jgi:hypothetical protein
VAAVRDTTAIGDKFIRSEWVRIGRGRRRRRAQFNTITDTAVVEKKHCTVNRWNL